MHSSPWDIKCVNVTLLIAIFVIWCTYTCISLITITVLGLNFDSINYITPDYINFKSVGSKPANIYLYLINLISLCYLRELSTILTENSDRLCHKIHPKPMRCPFIGYLFDNHNIPWSYIQASFISTVFMHRFSAP